MSPHEVAPEAAQDALDPGLEAILNVLAAHALEGTGRDLSLARLAKRTGLRQSTLRRYLTLLEEAGIVRVKLAEDGGGSVGVEGERVRLEWAGLCGAEGGHAREAVET